MFRMMRSRSADGVLRAFGPELLCTYWWCRVGNGATGICFRFTAFLGNHSSSQILASHTHVHAAGELRLRRDQICNTIPTMLNCTGRAVGMCCHVWIAVAIRGLAGTVSREADRPGPGLLGEFSD